MTSPVAGAVAAPASRRPAVALLGAYAVSLVGSRLSMVALPLFVLLTTGSATRTGLVAMAETAPYALSTALAGPVTDRVGTRRVSIASDVASALVVGAIPLLHATGHLTFTALLVLCALAGTCRGPGDGAKYVMIPTVARAAGMPVERGIAFADGTSRAASVLGPLGAAALVGLVGAAGALTADAASFLVAAVVVAVGVPAAVAAIGPAELDADDPDAAGSYRARLASGARFVRRDGLLRSIVGMVSVTNLLDAAYGGVLLAVWATRQGGGAPLVGVVAATMSAGAVIGALTAAAVGHRLPRRATFGWGFFLVGAPRFVVLALDVPLPVVLVVLFVGGLGAGTLNPILGAVEVERIPEHLRARVLSLMGSLAFALIPFGGLVGGLLSDHLGVRTALLVCGAVYLVATTLPALRPEWRELDAGRRRAAEVPAPGSAPAPAGAR
ncbi:MFS transporter [Angustibacter aerolatus]